MEKFLEEFRAAILEGKEVISNYGLESEGVTCFDAYESPSEVAHAVAFAQGMYSAGAVFGLTEQMDELEAKIWAESDEESEDEESE